MSSVGAKPIVRVVVVPSILVQPRPARIILAQRPSRVKRSEAPHGLAVDRPHQLLPRLALQQYEFQLIISPPLHLQLKGFCHSSRPPRRSFNMPTVYSSNFCHFCRIKPIRYPSIP